MWGPLQPSPIACALSHAFANNLSYLCEDSLMTIDISVDVFVNIFLRSRLDSEAPILGIEKFEKKASRRATTQIKRNTASLSPPKPLLSCLASEGVSWDLQPPEAITTNGFAFLGGSQEVVQAVCLHQSEHLAKQLLWSWLTYEHLSQQPRCSWTPCVVFIVEGTRIRGCNI